MQKQLTLPKEEDGDGLVKGMQSEIIARTPTQSIPSKNQQDPMIWALTSSGNFTIKLAWNAIRGKQLIAPWRQAVDVLTPNRSGPP